MSDKKPKEVTEPTRETQGGPEGNPEAEKRGPIVTVEETRTEEELVREGEKDTSKPQATQAKEDQVKNEADKPKMQNPTGKLVQPDEMESPARNDPYASASPEERGLDREQSLGYTDRTPLEENEAQTQVRHLPDAPHQEPSTYTPSGARPGQQNPVNPQGSPGTDPTSPAVGARPFESSVIIEQGLGRDGSYTKVVTPGEKNPSQRGYEIDNQPTTHNDY